MSPSSQSPKVRLYIDADLVSGAELAPRDDQAHYLRRGMRLGDGDAVGVAVRRAGLKLDAERAAGRSGLDGAEAACLVVQPVHDGIAPLDGGAEGVPGLLITAFYTP